MKTNKKTDVTFLSDKDLDEIQNTLSTYLMPPPLPKKVGCYQCKKETTHRRAVREYSISGRKSDRTWCSSECFLETKNKRRN